MPKFKENTSSAMKAQRQQDPDSMIARGNPARGGGTKPAFYMKYQGNHSAFPFKSSPMKTNGGGHGDDGVFSTETSPNPKDPPSSPRVKKPPGQQD